MSNRKRAVFRLFIPLVLIVLVPLAVRAEEESHAPARGLLDWLQGITESPDTQ